MQRNKLVAGALLALMCLVSSSCMGRFALWDKCEDFNIDVVEHRWAREGVFLGMNIIPVYPLAFLGDILIINSIEFWTGENPLNDESPLVDEAASDD